MKELKLSLTEEINLRHHHSIQYATTEPFENNEIILVQKVGLCRVTVKIKGLIKLTITQEQWMYTREGELVEMPMWGLAQ